MPSRRQLVRAEVRRMPPMPLGSLGDPEATTPLSDAELCDRAVHTIWRSLDEHDLLDERARSDLAAVLEPLTALGFGDRPRRLINILRLPNPIDAAHLYWLTRRLLTLVPELQAAAMAFSRPGCDLPPPLA